MNRLLLLICLLSSATRLDAQNVTAFLDYMDRLMVFDKGIFTQIEPQKPKSILFGGNSVVYSDVRDDLKVYRNGKVETIEQASGIEPIVTDHFVGFTVAGILKVNDGRTRMLCPNVGVHLVEDSLAAFKDEVNQTVNVYYRGETVKLEDQLAGNSVVQWKSGDNILAWVSNYDRLFKAFYQGTTYQLSDLVTEMDFQCGLDMVAYRDAYDHTFKVFHKGTIYDLEERMPQRYQVGKGVLAWLDLTGSLKVFEGGHVHTAMTFEPQRWAVVDSLLVIEDQAFFNVFSNGTLHTVERVVPKNWQVSWGNLAYVDVDQTLKVWHHGKSEVVVRGQPVQEYRLDRGVLLARLNNRSARIWWRGRTYEY
jgi:hypothetical protein